TFPRAPYVRRPATAPPNRVLPPHASVPPPPVSAARSAPPVAPALQNRTKGKRTRERRAEIKPDRMKRTRKRAAGISIPAARSHLLSVEERPIGVSGSGTDVPPDRRSA